MELLRQVSLNSLWILIARVSTQALGLVFVAVVARKLGVEVFGQYTVLASIVFIGNIFTTFGTDALIIRQIAQERRMTPLVSKALWLQICLSCVWCLAAVVIGVFLDFSFDFRAALILYNLSLLPLSLYSVVSSVLRAMERMDLFMGLNLCSMLLQMLGLIFLREGQIYGLLILCAWLFVVQVITSLIGLGVGRLYIPDFSLPMNFSFGEVFALARSGWRLALFYPIGLFSQRLNVFVLTAVSGSSVTGWYSASARLVEGLKLGHFSLLNGLMPEMSRPISVERKKLMDLSLYGLMAWSFFVAVGVTLFAAPIVTMIYGEAFEPSVMILKIVVWALVPYTFSSYFSVSLIMRGAERLVLNANLICLAASAFLYVVLISEFGVRGAAWAALILEALLASILLFGNFKRAFLEKHGT